MWTTTPWDGEPAWQQQQQSWVQQRQAEQAAVPITSCHDGGWVAPAGTSRDRRVAAARTGRRYQSATLGTFQTTELIETFVNYHENIKK